jgi:hypothetical protein
VTFDEPPPLTPNQRRRLMAAIDAYDAGDNRYDEVFLEVRQRITTSGWAGKLDLAAIVLWKRSAQGSWVKDLLATPEAVVREITRAAFATSGDLPVLRALASLPGFAAQGPIATALMAAYNPYDWGVLDSRATKALADLDRPIGKQQRDKTLRYLTAIRKIRDELANERPGITARDVDKGLWVLDKTA